MKNDLILCMLVKNQAKELDILLSKIHKNFSRIIIVNNNSIDYTSDVIKKYNAKEILYQGDGWDKGRNLYIDAVDEGWMLVLDADEEISVQNIQKIKKKIINTEDNIYAYKIPRIDFLGEGKWVEVLNNRLFRKDERIFYNDKVVHSTISNSLLKDKQHTDIWYDINFVHWAGIYESSLKDGKRNRYIQELEEDLKKKRDQFESTYRLALEYFAIDNYEDCERLLDITLDYEFSNPIYKNRPLLYKALLYIFQNKYEQAKEILFYLRKDVKTYVEEAYLYIYLAKIFYLQNDSDTVKYLEQALLLLPYSPLCNLNYGMISLETDKKEYHIKKAISLLPDLLNFVIYDKGDKNNIFRIQDMSIFSMEEIKDAVTKFV